MNNRLPGDLNRQELPRSRKRRWKGSGLNQPTRKARPSARKARIAERSDEYQSLDFRRKNWILFGAGLVAIAAGFAMLAMGDITLAPILLVGGYLVLIPWAILTRTPAQTPTIRSTGNGGE